MLTPEQQAVMDQVKAEAISRGYPELQSTYLANAAATMFDGMASVVWDYNIWHEGKVQNPAKGKEMNVKAKDVGFMEYALNRMVALGVPINLLYSHQGEDSYGVIGAVRMDDSNNCRAALVAVWPYDDQIRSGQCRLSAGLSGEFTDAQYTEGKTVDYWPLNWAIVPPKTIPAMPPGEIAIAADTKVPVEYWNFAADNLAKEQANEKGDVEMTPEERKALISDIGAGLGQTISDLVAKALEPFQTELSSLKEANVALGSKLDSMGNDVAAPQVEAALKDVKARALPAQRTEIQKAVDDAKEAGPAAQLAILNALSIGLPATFAEYGKDQEVANSLSVGNVTGDIGDDTEEKNQLTQIDMAFQLMEENPEKYPNDSIALEAVRDGVKPKKVGE